MAGNSNERLSKRLADLDQRVADVTKEQRRLSELLKIKNHWHSEIKDWIGREVRVSLQNDQTLIGKLKWTDNYNVAITTRRGNSTRIINKGAIAFLQLERRKEKDGE